MSGFRFYTYTDYEYRINQTQKYLSLPISLVKPTKHTSADDISHELNIPYTVFEILVAIFAIVGNLMVIIVFQRERKLQRRTNYYIVSLAIADFLVGSLGVPFAIMASIGLPTNLYACLFTVSLLVVLCTISIFCLLAVSVDRYWAILYPMAYSRTVRTRTAIGIISMCWLAGALVGFMPLFGWHADVASNQACLFVEVMDYDYLVFLYFATIITPAILMLAFYTHIYQVIVKQVRQIVTMNPLGDCSRRSSTTPIQSTSCGPTRSLHGGTMLRVLGAARKRDVKATQNLSIIVLFFMICWIPLYTINCIQAFCRDCVIHPKLTLFCIILSHLNSAVNPVLYAYHLKDFRAALKNLILRIIGVDVEQRIDAMHRFSVASQHRLHSTEQFNRHALQPRLYIDSPVWLRQQQQQQEVLTLNKSPLPPKCGVVTPCLNNINQAVAAVASVNAEVWTILEKTTTPNGKTNGSSELDENTRKLKDVPESCHQSKSLTNSVQLTDEENSYAYINEHVVSCANEDLDDVFYIQKDTQNSGKHKIQNEIQFKLRSDVGVDQSDIQNNHNFSEFESSKQKTSSTNSSKQEEIRPLRKLFSRSSSSSNSPPMKNSSKTSSVSPVHQPRFRPSRGCQSRSVARAMMNRSYSCTSDPVTPNHKSLPNQTQEGGMLDLLDGCEIHYDNIHSNNLNYFTIPHSQQQQQNSPAEEKFNAIRAMSQLLFPPVVKHSSLFQIFQPSTCDTATLSKHTKTHISAEESLECQASVVKEHKEQPGPLKII